jgi:hypothetical protein
MVEGKRQRRMQIPDIHIENPTPAPELPERDDFDAYAR